MVIYAELYALLLKQEIMNSVNRPDLQILTALSVCAGHYGKLYCYPSQDKILSWLARQGRRMSRRTLNRHLHALERRQQCPGDPGHGRHPAGQQQGHGAVAEQRNAADGRREGRRGASCQQQDRRPDPRRDARIDGVADVFKGHGRLGPGGTFALAG